MEVLWVMNPKLDEFEKMFGSKLGYNMLNRGHLTYEKDKKLYDAYSLKDEELNDLITKSVDDGVDYVFERVKDKEFHIELDPNCCY